MVNGINCQNYQLLIGRKEMVVLRRAQSKTFDVILSSSFPVILSSSKDDTRRRLKVGDPVPLRRAQSDSRAQRDTQYVTLRQAQSDRKSKDDTKSQDDPQRRSKSRN